MNEFLPPFIHYLKVIKLLFPRTDLQLCVVLLCLKNYRNINNHMYCLFLLKCLYQTLFLLIFTTKEFQTRIIIRFLALNIIHIASYFKFLQMCKNNWVFMSLSVNILGDISIYLLYILAYVTTKFKRKKHEISAVELG